MKYHGIETATTAQTVFSEQAMRVMRNTYALLALTMIPTIIGAYVGVQMDWTFVMVHPIISILGYFAVTYGLLFAIQKTANSALGVLFLLAFTLLMGVALGPLLQVALSLSNGVKLISYAAGLTALIFFSLAGYVTVTGKDFSGLGKFLFVGLLIAIVAMIANIFFQMPAFSLAVSSAVVLIMSGYILYDVSRVVHGGETNYILAATSLYLNIYNLFIHLLRILMILSGSRD